MFILKIHLAKMLMSTKAYGEAIPNGLEIVLWSMDFASCTQEDDFHTPVLTSQLPYFFFMWPLNS